MRPSHRRTAASVVTLALSAVAVLLPRTASAREVSAVDDERGGVGEGADAAASEADNDAIEEEALGPRSNLRTRAQEVSFDASARSLELAGNVRVDSPPFHLTSQRIKLTRTRYGIEIVGKGSLAFCPCLGTPLKVDFEEAIVAPPGDLILKNPTLRFYDVPILPLPYFWLRSDEKLGVLPPDIAYRGHDGLFVGGRRPRAVEEPRREERARAAWRGVRAARLRRRRAVAYAVEHHEGALRPTSGRRGERRYRER